MLYVAIVGFSWNPILSPFWDVAKGALKAVGFPASARTEPVRTYETGISTDGLRASTPMHVAPVNSLTPVNHCEIKRLRHGPYKTLFVQWVTGREPSATCRLWMAAMTAPRPDAAHGRVSACRGGRVVESGWKRDRGQKQQSNRYIPRQSFA